MTRTISEKIMQRIATVSADIERLRQVEVEIATTGTASATLSAGGGQKSYTHLDLDKIGRLIAKLERELMRLRARLAGGSGDGIRRIMVVR